MRRLEYWLVPIAAVMLGCAIGVTRPVTAPSCAARADTSAMVVDVVNYSSDSVRVSVAVADREFSAIGIVGPHTRRMLVVPSCALGNGSLAMVGFEQLGHGAELTPWILRTPGRVTFIGWSIGAPPPAPTPARASSS